MISPLDSFSRVAELEARQDQVLRDLEELEGRIAQVIRSVTSPGTLPIRENLATSPTTPIALAG